MEKINRLRIKSNWCIESYQYFGYNAQSFMSLERYNIWTETLKVRTMTLFSWKNISKESEGQREMKVSNNIWTKLSAWIQTQQWLSDSSVNRLFGKQNWMWNEMEWILWLLIWICLQCLQLKCLLGHCFLPRSFQIFLELGLYPCGLLAQVFNRRASLWFSRAWFSCKCVSPRSGLGWVTDTTNQDLS